MLLSGKSQGQESLINGQAVEAHKDHCLCTMVSRDVFDNLLLEKAKDGGAEVRTGEKVFQCMEKPEFVEVTT